MQPYGPTLTADLGRWMQWLLTAHVRRYHGHYQTSGHVWQGRFKAFPIEEDEHLLTVLRYIERNPLRAGLVRRAEDWLWSSLRQRRQESTDGFIEPGPVALPESWMEWVNQAQTDGELEGLRASVNRGVPYGNESWMERIASLLGLEFTLRPRVDHARIKKGECPLLSDFTLGTHPISTKGTTEMGGAKRRSDSDCLH